MRAKRRKVARRTLRYFKINFGISEPYKVILDGNFMFVAQQKQFDIQDKLNKIFETEKVTLCTCGAVLNELRSLKDQHSDKAKDFDRCYELASHLKKLKIFKKPGSKGNDGEVDESLSQASRDILAIVGKLNKHKYVVATQDEALKTQLRAAVGIPIVSISRTMIQLEPPSHESVAHVEGVQQGRLAPSKQDRRFLHNVYVENKDSDAQVAKSQSAAGSKKKKKRALAPEASVVEPPKRKRTRKRNKNKQ